MRPFPFVSLPRWRRGEVIQSRVLFRRLALREVPGGDALGASFFARASAPRLARAEELRRAHDATVFAAVFAHPVLGVVAALMDVPLALTLAARALGGDAPEHTRELSPAHEGALATLVARALTRVCAPDAPPVLRAITDDLDGALDAVGSADALVAWPWRLTAEDVAGQVTVVVSQRALLRVDDRARAADLARFDDLPVTVTAIAGHATWGAQEAAGLARGDLLVLDSLSRDGDALAGTVSLTAGERAEVAIRAEVVGPRAVRVAGEAEARESAAVSARSNDTDDASHPTAPRTERLGALTVEVSVEVARTQLPLAEVASWRAGEVVTFAQPLGAAVTLHVSGRPVARGELVDVDGEVGVRITELL